VAGASGEREIKKPQVVSLGLGWGMLGVGLAFIHSDKIAIAIILTGKKV